LQKRKKNLHVAQAASGKESLNLLAGQKGRTLDGGLQVIFLGGGEQDGGGNSPKNHLGGN